jgi:hypothetical protein
VNLSPPEKDSANNNKKQFGKARKIIFSERKSRIFAKCKNVSVIAWFHEFNDKTKIWLNYNWLWLQSDKHSQNFSMLCFAVPSIRIILDFKKNALRTFWVTQIYP